MCDSRPQSQEGFFLPLQLISQIKVETACVQKNISFMPFIKMNPKNQHVDIFLDLLDEFKHEKIKFVTSLDQSQDDKCYIDISESPVHVEDGCNYFLLNAFWIAQKSPYLTASKPNSTTYGFSNSKNQTKFKDPILLSKQIFINLCYMLSSTIYVPAENLTDLLLTIKQDNKYFFGYLNQLKVVNFLGLEKKQQGRISTTAAETKAFHYDTIESDIFEEEFSFYDKGKESRSNSGPRKNYFSQSSKINFHQRTADRQSKYFSRTSYVEVQQKNLTQKILQQICQFNDSKNQSFLMYQTVLNLLQKLKETHKLLSLQEFQTMNTSVINNQIFDKILANYQNSIQQQFDQIDEKSIDEIKALLKQLFDKALMQFYEQFNYASNPEAQNQMKDKLLNAICQAEKVLFENINKGKRQSFSRRLSFFDNEHYLDSSISQNETKFNVLLGERISYDQEIGFNLYRETIKDKINKIFAELAGDNQKKTNFKSRKGKLMSRNELSTNIDRRIDILEGQKRNLEQSLHYEQKLQENLMEYYYGKQSMPNRKEIETISEYSEDRE